MSTTRSFTRRAATMLVASVALATTSSLVAPSASAERVSDCDFNLDWPHLSAHEPGKVTSNAVISCRFGKLYLGVETKLAPVPFGGVFYTGEAVNNSGVGTYVHAAGATDCRPGEYYAQAEFLMVEADGTRHERSHKTPTVTVAC